MGAHNFYTEENGKTAKEAYRSAVEQAHYEYGHDSYNGTISTTNGFQMVTLKEGQEVHELEEEVLDNPRFEKWGKCACLDKGNGVFAFFGWAAS